MKRIYKVLLAVSLAMAMFFLVFMFAEEISALKRAVYDRLSGSAVSAEETEPTQEDNDFRELYEAFPPFAHSPNAWYQNTQLIYHAGGGVDGLAYTNSREAIEETLTFGNFLEIDFGYTADGHLVCIHSWEYITGSPEPMTLAQYKEHKIFGEYTTLTAVELIAYMKEREDLYIVIDTKELDVLRVTEDLIALAEGDTAIVDRFIIQLYEEGSKGKILELYPFAEENFLFTCYKSGTDPETVLRLCMEEGISVVTVQHGTWDSEAIDLFTQKGILIYEHTVNRLDHVTKATERGVYGFYTDFLTELSPH